MNFHISPDHMHMTIQLAYMLDVHVWLSLSTGRKLKLSNKVGVQFYFWCESFSAAPINRGWLISLTGLLSGTISYLDPLCHPHMFILHLQCSAALLA